MNVHICAYMCAVCVRVCVYVLYECVMIIMDVYRQNWTNLYCEHCGCGQAVVGLLESHEREVPLFDEKLEYIEAAVHGSFVSQHEVVLREPIGIDLTFRDHVMLCVCVFEKFTKTESYILTCSKSK